MNRKLILVAAVAACLASTAYGQETPTERQAAAGVVHRLDALEQSLDVPKLVAALTGPDATRDQVVANAEALMHKDLLAMGDDITRHPEVGFEETRSVKILADYLKKHGFEVTMGVAGLKTAFVAKQKRGNGGPNLGVIVEYDALRGTKGAFHGDQHSTQGPIGLAAAVAIADYIEKAHVPGNVTVFGTPAEEIPKPAVKSVMFKAGVFSGMDIIVRSHSSSATTRPAPGFGTCCMNINGATYTFYGAPAHQLATWNGRNALEGVIKLFNGIDTMRSSMRPETRIQGVITQGGAAPNVVPDKAQADFYIRYPDPVYLAQTQSIVDNAAIGAAKMTGTHVVKDQYAELRDGISVGTLAELGFAYMQKYGATGVQAEPGKPQGYDETGSVSAAIPGLGFSARTSNAPNHTYEMEADALTDVGHQGFVVDAKAMTAVLYDFLTHADYRSVVKKEFTTIQGLYGQYLDELKTAYPLPKIDMPAATPAGLDQQ